MQAHLCRTAIGYILLLLGISGRAAELHGNLAAAPTAIKYPTLVPPITNPAPDYFCTWNVQGFVCSYTNAIAQRAQLCESNFFGSGKDQGWINLYAKARGDLLLILDDAWDIPLNGDASYYGSLILNQERFPTFTGTPAERLKKLVQAAKAAGWKGLGGWICAQPAPNSSQPNETNYWQERLEWMRLADFAYLKVDWGKHEHDVAWRRQLTELSHQAYPQLIVEHAMTPEALSFADVYRTYDVENVMGVAVTIDRVAGLLSRHPDHSPTVVNCEDEPYIAAALGCAMGVMRHPFAGPLPNGQPDMVFPVPARDLKHRLDEVVRVVRWHKIAPPMRLDAVPVAVDGQRLKDTWQLQENETYTAYRPGDWRSASAPARIARGLPLPSVEVSQDQVLPFVLATRFTSGAIAIATVGRTAKHEYLNPKANVTIPAGNASGPFGIFGYYASLKLQFDRPLGKVRVLAQDLMADESQDITSAVQIKDNEILIPGELIAQLGLASATTNDVSEPGLVLSVTQLDE